MNEKNDQWYFYSEGQLKRRIKKASKYGDILKRNFCRLEDDSIVEYTERNTCDKPRGRCKDYKHLGKGRHNHSFPERYHKK